MNPLETIKNAYKRCRQQPHERQPRFTAYLEVSPQVVEQRHHGTTDYALAAWFELRELFLGRVRSIHGEAEYLVPDIDGKRTIAQPALAIKTDNLTLYLTGASWGYGGEGPHGTAAILADLGVFPDVESALKFVGAQNCFGSWTYNVGTIGNT